MTDDTANSTIQLSPKDFNFGKKLCHNEQRVRDKTLSALRRYCTKKSEWSSLDFEKLWKCLFYCMWMSDKPKIQKELSERLAQLIFCFPQSEDSIEFIDIFFRTMGREWHGIDGLRLDKYYTLVRLVINKTFEFMEKQEWNKDLVKRFTDSLSKEVFGSHHNGLRFHLADIFVMEICKSTGKNISSMVFLQLLQPFLQFLSHESDRLIFNRISESVLVALAKQYQFKDTSDQSEENNENCFEQIDVDDIKTAIFQVASSENILEKNRSSFYNVYNIFEEISKKRKLSGKQRSPSNKKRKNVSENESKSTPASLEIKKGNSKVANDEIKKENPKTDNGVKKEENNSLNQQVNGMKVSLENKDIVKVSKEDSTTPFPRCLSCNGWGKDFVHVTRNGLCQYCWQNSKKTIAKSQQETEMEIQAKKSRNEKDKAGKENVESTITTTPKKVTFGKNKALDYTESVKRLKASTNRRLSNTPNGKIPSNGLLRVKSDQGEATRPKPVTKRRKAADFF